MRNRLTQMLGIEYPVLSAPMGNVAGGALAGAVSRAGGLGLIGAGYGDRAWLQRELKQAGGARVGVGFITWALAEAPDLLDLALDYRPVAVMFSFGECTPFFARVRAAGAKILCQVQTLHQARQAAQAGADAIVAQGTEAGGHGGGRSTFTLVPAAADAVAPIPVLAAGGIADGRGLAAALMLGASGVVVGTRLLASDESLAHSNIKRQVVAATGDRTLRTRVFDIVRGYPWPEHITGRALLNSFAATWHGREGDLWAELEEQRRCYRQAVSEADTDTAVVFAGEAVDLIESIAPAGEVLRQMVSQADLCLRRHAPPRLDGDEGE
jgi:nitronate monooxygenase